MTPDVLRKSFDEDAERYHRARPRYPAALVADLLRIGGIGPSSRVLEIGPGTGQLTLAMATSGCRIVGVELGARLAAVARRNLEGHGAEVVVSPFERWQPPAEPFDVVVAATSFHWLDPEVRVRKAAEVLRPGGTLATVTTFHVAGDSADVSSSAFFRDVQACYERWDPATPPGLRLEEADAIPSDSGELDRSGLFGPATFHRHVSDISYSTEEYLDVLMTYSGHRTLEAGARRGLLACIAGLIDERHGGRITKRYMFELRTAHTLSTAQRRAGGTS